MIIDCGCDDFGRAKLNREIVSKKLYTWAYVQVENALAGLAFSGKLPLWMPKGDLPYIYLEEINWLPATRSGEDDDPWLENVRKLREERTL